MVMTAKRVRLELTESEAEALIEIASQGITGYEGVGREEWPSRNFGPLAGDASRKLHRAARNPSTRRWVLELSDGELRGLLAFAVMGETDYEALADDGQQSMARPQWVAGVRATDRLRDMGAELRGETNAD